LADLQRTIYPCNWSLIRCRSSAGQRKFAGQRPTFYHCATPPTYFISTAYVTCHRHFLIYLISLSVTCYLSTANRLITIPSALSALNVHSFDFNHLNTQMTWEYFGEMQMTGTYGESVSPNLMI